jgi:hypothetical protein
VVVECARRREGRGKPREKVLRRSGCPSPFPSPFPLSPFPLASPLPALPPHSRDVHSASSRLLVFLRDGKHFWSSGCFFHANRVTRLRPSLAASLASPPFLLSNS